MSSGLLFLLWNLFQNDMPLQVNEVNLTMYADYHQIYAIHEDLDFLKVARFSLNGPGTN